MGIGISIFIGAVGAILRYAVTITHKNGFNIHTGGVILMIVGLIGLVISALFWSSFSPFGRRQSTTRSEELTTQDGREQGRVIRQTRDDVAI